MSKRALSPVVATVLLVSIVIILGLIVFLWTRGFVSERVEKFGRTVEMSCNDINFEAEILSNAGDETLDIINRGNVPIYGLNIKEIGRGEILVNQVFDGTLGLGQSNSIDLTNDHNIDLDFGDRILIVPIILGETNNGKVSHECVDENGKEVSVSTL